MMLCAFLRVEDKENNGPAGKGRLYREVIYCLFRLYGENGG
jgi:hypothetical protein